MRIVFLHGFAAGGAVWDPYRPAFADALMPTLQFSSDGTPILPELDEPAILVGWSMGAMLAVEILHRQPQFVKGLLLVSSGPSFVASDIFPEGKAPSTVRELRDAITKGDPKGLQSFQKQLFTAVEIRDGWLARFRRDIGPSLPTDPAALLAQLAFLESYRIPRQLAAVPVAVLHGDRDAIVEPAAAAAWRRLIPGAAARLVAEAGHALPFVRRDEVVAAVAALREACDA
ncbi:MAG TPA: alpha/beta fold hydrolase [bacterium]|nr:alpha/beta fold hydrolase [bacterium]